MKCIALLALVFTCSAHARLPDPGTPGAPADPRYCGEPARNADGTIKRNAAERAKFIAVWPMPRDGWIWHVDHVLPLKMGGCDRIDNMAWMPTHLKSCAVFCKDRYEMRVYRVKGV